MRPNDIVLSALCHCITGVECKRIDGEIPPGSETPIDVLLRVQGILKKGQNSEMTASPYISLELLVFTIMQTSPGLSGKQALNKMKKILPDFERAMIEVTKVKDLAAAAGREVNAADKRMIEGLTADVIGMPKDDLLEKAREIFGVKPSSVSGRITAKVTLEVVEEVAGVNITPRD